MFRIEVACLAVLTTFATLTVMQGAAQAEDMDAAALYEQHCAVCHGEEGNGKSRAAGSLRPPPRDFTTPRAAAELTNARLVHSISEGRPGTAMAAWSNQFSRKQIAALADYIQQQFLMPRSGDNTSEGRRIYAEYCSVCHGDQGNGNSRATRSLTPPPRDFTAPTARRELTRKRMMFSVTYGRANTAMGAWKSQLRPAQIEAVVDYIRTRFMGLSPGEEEVPASGQVAHGGHEGHGHHHGTPGSDTAAFLARPFQQGLKGRFPEGEALYRDSCVPCHGKNGDGRGPRAYFILPKPRDFGHPAARASLNRPHLYGAVAEGVVGTEMPAWEKVLSPQQIADVSEFVFRAFIRPDAADAAGHAGQEPERGNTDHGHDGHDPGH